MCSLEILKSIIKKLLLILLFLFYMSIIVSSGWLADLMLSHYTSINPQVVEVFYMLVVVTLGTLFVYYLEPIFLKLQLSTKAAAEYKRIKEEL